MATNHVNRALLLIGVGVFLDWAYPMPKAAKDNNPPPLTTSANPTSTQPENQKRDTNTPSLVQKKDDQPSSPRNDAACPRDDRPSYRLKNMIPGKLEWAKKESTAWSQLIFTMKQYGSDKADSHPNNNIKEKFPPEVQAQIRSDIKRDVKREEDLRRKRRSGSPTEICNLICTLRGRLLPYEVQALDFRDRDGSACTRARKGTFSEEDFDNITHDLEIIRKQ